MSSRETSAPQLPRAPARRARGRALRTAVLVGAPLVAVATLMLGLRIGAKDAVRAASVLAAPPGRPDPEGRRRSAFQLLTFVDDRGVRESVSMKGLSAHARDAEGREARWEGGSNEDGIAEMAFVWEAGAPVSPVHLTVRAEGDPRPLAEGDVAWEAREPRDEGTASVARPTRREGALVVDVLVEGQRLVPGFATDVWIRIAGAQSDAVTVALDPEPGLRMPAAPTATCLGTRNGVAAMHRDFWAHVSAVAEAHVTALGIEAHTASASGRWAGQLPVAPGAFFVSLPRAIQEGSSKEEAVLVAPNPRTVVYAEVDDEEGRVFGAALPVRPDPGDPVPRAHLPLPPLAAGLHWLVVSGEPRGAEQLGGATVARPFLVSAHPESPIFSSPCGIGPTLASRPAHGFPRTAALDGLAARSAGNRGRRTLGLAIALVALAAAAAIDVLLLARIAREARTELEAAAREADGGDAHAVTEAASGGTVIVGILASVLGFALLAALLVSQT